VNIVFDGFTKTLKEGGRIQGIGEFYRPALQIIYGKESEDRKAHKGRVKEVAVLQGGEGIERESKWLRRHYEHSN
jgi:hypothetical protein